MNKTLIIFRKEFLLLWRSPLALTLIGIFSLLAGWTFFNLLVGYVDNIQAIPADMQSQISFLEEVVLRLYSNLNFILLFFIPPLTMRLIFASPITDTQIILGKFLSTWAFTLVLILPTLLFPIVLFWAGVPDQKVLLGCYIGLSLNMACYVGLGLLASALTENQVVAALLGFMFIMFTWLLAWISQGVDNFMLSEILRWMSITGHFENLLKGVLSSSDLVYYLSVIVMSLYVSRLTLSSRDW